MLGIDYRKLRELVTIVAVLDALHWSPSMRNQSQGRGPCPICDAPDRKRSFSVDRRGNRFQCFACGARGNQLDLFVKACKLTLYPAAIELCRRLRINVPYRQTEQRRGTRTSSVRAQRNVTAAASAMRQSATAQDERPLCLEDPGDKCIWKV